MSAVVRPYPQAHPSHPLDNISSCSSKDANPIPSNIAPHLSYDDCPPTIADLSAQDQQSVVRTRLHCQLQPSHRPLGLQSALQHNTRCRRQNGCGRFIDDGARITTERCGRTDEDGSSYCIGTNAGLANFNLL